MLKKHDNKKVLVFDMGNTLINFYSNDVEADKIKQGLANLYAYLKSLFPSVTYEDVFENFYEPWSQAKMKRQHTMVEYSIEEYLNNMLSKHQGELTYNQCVEAIRMYFIPFVNAIKADRDAYDVLKTCKDYGYKIVILSNTPYFSEINKECFELLGLDGCIDEYIFSYTYKIAKPDKAIFEYVPKLLGVKHSECIMIGDSLRKDMYPAQQLGWTGIWYNKNDEDNYLDIPQLIEINQLSEVLDHGLELEEVHDDLMQEVAYDDLMQEDDYDISEDI